MIFTFSVLNSFPAGLKITIYKEGQVILDKDILIVTDLDGKEPSIFFDNGVTIKFVDYNDSAVTNEMRERYKANSNRLDAGEGMQFGLLNPHQK